VQSPFEEAMKNYSDNLLIIHFSNFLGTLKVKIRAAFQESSWRLNHFPATEEIISNQDNGNNEQDVNKTAHCV
jgi:hypothetical protein